MTPRALVLALAVLLVLPFGASARPGDLDRRYGDRGALISRALEGGAVALRDGSGVLIAGGTTKPGLVRITASGRLDRRFGRRRGVAFAPRVTRMTATDLKRSRNEVRVAAVSAALDRPPVQVLRFSRNGQARRTVTHAEPLIGPVQLALLRPGGETFLLTSPDCGFYESPCAPSQVRAVAPDGGADRSFGNTGTVTVCPAPTSRCPRIVTGAVRPDGRLVLGVVRGRAALPRLVHLTPDGALDRSFGADGVVDLPVPPDALHLQRDGAVLAAGPGRRGRLARVVRVTAAGAIDRRFGAGGVAVVGSRGRISGQPRAMLVDRAGRIYVTAERLSYTRLTSRRDRRPHVVRLRSSGRTDRTFGRRGVATVPQPPAAQDYASDDTHLGAALVLDGRGGLLVVGQRLTAGETDPARGCGVRDDLCAVEARLAVWRLRTR
jgi:hypothetical protein